MEIMGGLIKLDRQNVLPIPWFMRAHLGLETGSRVWYAATKPERKDRLPDILVSPLNPRSFHEITTVTMSYDEGIGTLADVLDHIQPPVNIALADSVTLERRDKHRINLVLERAQGGQNEDYQEKRSQFIRQFSWAPGEPDYKLIPDQIYESEQAIFGARSTKVTEGEINIGNLLRQIEEEHGSIAGQYDFSKVVASSNPDQRLIRYIVPRKGVVTLRIPHEDVPRVLHSVAKGIADRNYNILCSRLSRARSKHENSSTFVAECEPMNPRADPNKLLRDLTNNQQIYEGTFRDGVPARDILYPKPPGSINIRPHPHYRENIAAMKGQLRGKKPLFLSRRFVEYKTEDANIKQTYEKVLREIRAGAELAGWEALEAPPVETGGLIDQAVFPSLWLSQALLVLAFLEDASGGVSPNQANELGFALGQNEPAAILVDETKRRDLSELSNYAGRTLLTYSLSTAFDPAEPSSIREQIRRWLDKLAVEPID